MAASPRKVAQNIISKYGLDSFQKLIELFKAGENGAKIGAAFNVSRQRVSQWRSQLGLETRGFIPDEGILDLVECQPPPPSQSLAEPTEASASDCQ